MIILYLQAGHVCGDDLDLIEGHPTGSVRVSFGYMSTIEDAEVLLQFVVDCFLESQHIKPCFLHSEGQSTFKAFLSQLEQSQNKVIVRQVKDKEQHGFLDYNKTNPCGTTPSPQPDIAQRSEVTDNDVMQEDGTLGTDQSQKLADGQRVEKEAIGEWDKDKPCQNRNSPNVTLHSQDTTTIKRDDKSRGIDTMEEEVARLEESQKAKVTTIEASQMNSGEAGKVMRGLTRSTVGTVNRMVLTDIILYPVKSCGPLKVSIFVNIINHLQGSHISPYSE